eukprot:gene34020-biopygen3762
MLEKWRRTPDFRLLLRRIFKQCVEFDIRLVVEWVPSKENQFADAPSRKEMRMFFELHKEWKAEFLWRKNRDDWKMFAGVLEKLDRRFGPFSVETCCDAFGANRQTLVCWTVRQDYSTQDWAGLTAWCNPPFSRILSILLHFLACKRRQNVGTSACFVIPVWPTANFYKFIVARPSVFIPVERFEAENDHCSRPRTVGDEAGDQEMWELEDGVAYFGINSVARNTHASTVKYSTIKAYLAALRDLHLELGYPMPGFEDLKRLRRTTLRGIKRLKGNPKYHKLGIGPKELVRIFFQGKIDLTEDNDLTCWTGCLLAFGGCFRKANITTKKQACFAQSGVILRGV